MLKIVMTLIILVVSINLSFAEKSKQQPKQYYGAGLCSVPGYSCIKIKRGQTWKKLWPKVESRDLIQRINRTNMRLRTGRKIAVPTNLENLTIFDISPFPIKIKKQNVKLIIIDQLKLAWGAYDTNGDLQRWGPISSGKDYCPDVGRACTTITGIYYIFNAKDSRCVSNIFPVRRGGAKMPYCMFFYRGYALHGSYEVPGYRDSHGCVRLFKRDAKWLNKEFVDLPAEENNFLGTKIVIQKLINL